jgi:nitroreductase/Pyruvate/2-oxoacid:ferredoxin oxidoreductase delta subunit
MRYAMFWEEFDMKRSVTPPEVVTDNCIRCGQCATVCPSFVIEMVNDMASVKRASWCVGCGHCAAVCPTEAVVFRNKSPQPQHLPEAGPAVSSERLERLLRERRSVRNYTPDAVPQALLDRILDAGRYAPTGTNSQNVHYAVLRSPEQISALRAMTVRFYDTIFSRVRGTLGGWILSLIAGRRTVEYLREFLPKVEFVRKRMKEGRDPLFYHAPVLILAHAESWDPCSSFNCSVALYHCSLVAHTLGVGCCFNGFLVNAANHDRKIRERLAIPPDHRCYAAMTLGYQNVAYRRLVSRDPARIAWR